MSKFTQSDLRKAISAVAANSYLIEPYDEELRVVLDAAIEHAGMMPKEIDVWDVEYAVKLENGSWYPSVSRYPALEGAEAFAALIRESAGKMPEPVIIKRTAGVPHE